MNTKLLVQGIGYNVRNYIFEESRPIGNSCTTWILGEYIYSSSEIFYDKWKRLSRMTYRRNWPDPFFNPRTGIMYDSDAGWGCTLRSCQMLLANAMGRASTKKFSDDKNAVFGIHGFLSKSPASCGEWFGPTSVSVLLKDLLQDQVELGIVVSFDGVFSTDEIHAAAAVVAHASGSLEASPRSAGGFIDLAPVSVSEDVEEEIWLIGEEAPVSPVSPAPVLSTPRRSSPRSWDRPVLLMVAIRLSPDSVMTETVLGPLLSYMTLPSFAGLLGGPDRRCYYIVGIVSESVITDDGGCDDDEGEEDLQTSLTVSAQGNVSPVSAQNNVCSLLAIDPHVVEESGAGGFQNAPHPLRVCPQDLCPSIAIAFKVESEDELDSLRSQIEAVKNSHGLDGFSFIHFNP